MLWIIFVNFYRHVVMEWPCSEAGLRSLALSLPLTAEPAECVPGQSQLV